MSRNTNKTNATAAVTTDAVTADAAVPATDDTIFVLPDGMTEEDVLAILAKHQKQQEQRKAYNQRDEVKEKRAEYRKEYFARPEVQEKRAEYRKEYFARPEVQERRAAYREEYFAKPEVKERRKSARALEQQLLDQALEMRVEQVAGNAAIAALWDEYQKATGVKKGQVRTKLLTALSVLE